MKKIILTIAFLTVFLVFSGFSQAKTDIFGTQRVFTTTYGDKLATVHAGFTPLDDQPFSYGFVVSALFERNPVDESLRVEEWLSGVFVEHPVLAITSILPIGMTGDILGGAEISYLFGTNQEIYFTPYIAAEIDVTKNVSTRIEWRYNSRDTILEKHTVTAGVAVRW